MSAAIFAALLPVGGTPVLARTHHRAHVVAAQDPSPGRPTANSFYPEDIEGGVHGNLPFNNQIRKFTDPLNANGAGR